MKLPKFEIPTAANPKSTFWNVGYVIAGLLFILVGAIFARELQSLTGAAAVGLGAVSFGYHYTLDKFWQRADVLGIYALFSIGFAWQVSNLLPQDYSWLLICAAVGFTVVVALRYDEFSHTHIGLMGIANIVVMVMRFDLASFPEFFWLRLLQIVAALFLYISALLIGREAERHAKTSWEYDLLHAKWHRRTSAAILLTFI